MVQASDVLAAVRIGALSIIASNFKPRNDRVLNECLQDKLPAINFAAIHLGKAHGIDLDGKRLEEALLRLLQLGHTRFSLPEVEPREYTGPDIAHHLSHVAPEKLLKVLQTTDNLEVVLAIMLALCENRIPLKHDFVRYLLPFTPALVDIDYALALRSIANENLPSTAFFSAMPPAGDDASKRPPHALSRDRSQKAIREVQNSFGSDEKQLAVAPPSDAKQPHASFWQNLCAAQSVTPEAKRTFLHTVSQTLSPQHLWLASSFLNSRDSADGRQPAMIFEITLAQRAWSADMLFRLQRALNCPIGDLDPAQDPFSAVVAICLRADAATGLVGPFGRMTQNPMEIISWRAGRLPPERLAAFRFGQNAYSTVQSLAYQLARVREFWNKDEEALDWPEDLWFHFLRFTWTQEEAEFAMAWLVNALQAPHSDPGPYRHAILTGLSLLFADPKLGSLPCVRAAAERLGELKLLCDDDAVARSEAIVVLSWSERGRSQLRQLASDTPNLAAELFWSDRPNVDAKHNWELNESVLEALGACGLVSVLDHPQFPRDFCLGDDWADSRERWAANLKLALLPLFGIQNKRNNARVFIPLVGCVSSEIIMQEQYAHCLLYLVSTCDVKYDLPLRAETKWPAQYQNRSWLASAV